MKKLFSCLVLLVIFLSPSLAAHARGTNIEINTPAITKLKQSMQQRHGQLAPHYASGAVGLTRDGLIAMRDANMVPLARRQSVNALIAAENQDRNALYQEIARANNHPEWEEDIRATFSQRWISFAKSGWWYQVGSGSWAKK